MISLPYFDVLLRELAAGNPAIETALGDHVHWGFWSDGEPKPSTPKDFALGAERLCQRICDEAKIRKHQRVLDVGCGFGGTIRSLNRRFSPLDLVGLNIDLRQLSRAKNRISPTPGNTIQLIQGNAIKLPFEDNSFDAVLAVECIFHFSSRTHFLAETKRVLKKGGCLALSDFVVHKKQKAWHKPLSWLYGLGIRSFFGTVHDPWSLHDYQTKPHRSGLVPLTHQDITRETMPTYDILARMFAKIPTCPRRANLATRLVEWSHRTGHNRYMILSFRNE